MKVRTGRRGFTLLEMIVATALMSITVVGLLSLLTVSLSNASRVKQYDQMAMLARTKMNDLLLMKPMPVGQPLSGQFDAASGWNARVDPFESLPDAPPGSAWLLKVSLEVWWTAGGERKSVQLEGFRRDIVPQQGFRR